MEPIETGWFFWGKPGLQSIESQVQQRGGDCPRNGKVVNSNREVPPGSVSLWIQRARCSNRRCVPRPPWCHLPRVPAYTLSEKSLICAPRWWGFSFRWRVHSGRSIRMINVNDVNGEWGGNKVSIKCLWWWTEIWFGYRSKNHKNHTPFWFLWSQYDTVKEADQGNKLDFWSKHFKKKPIVVQSRLPESFTCKLYGLPRTESPAWFHELFF